MPGNSSEWENSICSQQQKRELQDNPAAWNTICAGSEIEPHTGIHADRCPYEAK